MDWTTSSFHHYANWAQRGYCQEISAVLCHRKSSTSPFCSLLPLWPSSARHRVAECSRAAPSGRRRRCCRRLSCATSPSLGRGKRNFPGEGGLQGHAWPRPLRAPLPKTNTPAARHATANADNYAWFAHGHVLPLALGGQRRARRVPRPAAAAAAAAARRRPGPAARRRLGRRRRRSGGGRRVGQGAHGAAVRTAPPCASRTNGEEIRLEEEEGGQPEAGVATRTAAGAGAMSSRRARARSASAGTRAGARGRRATAGCRRRWNGA